MLRPCAWNVCLRPIRGWAWSATPTQATRRRLTLPDATASRFLCPAIKVLPGFDHDLTFLDHRVDQICAKAITKMAVIWNIPYHEIGLLADFKAAHNVAAINRKSCVDRASG